MSDSMRPPLNRKIGIYAACGIGFLLLLLIAIVLVVKNPQAARAQKKAEQAQEQIEKMAPGNPQDVENDIDRREKEKEQADKVAAEALKRKQQAAASGGNVGDANSLFSAPIQGQSGSGAAQATQDTGGQTNPALTPEMLRELDEANKAAGHRPGASGNNGSSGGGNSMSFAGHSGASDNQAVWEADGGSLINTAKALSATSNDSSSRSSADPADKQEAFDVIAPKRPPVSANRLIDVGEMLRMVTVTAIDTRNPGDIVAMLTQDVYDSATLQHKLLEKGTLFKGSYSSKVSTGQALIQGSFQELILPHGAGHIDLGGMSAVTFEGATGIDGTYHSNLLRALGPSLVVALIGTGINNLSKSSTSTSSTGTVVQSPSVAEQMAPQINQEIMQRYAAAAPYFTTKPGTEFKIFVSKPIELPLPSTPASDAQNGGEQ